MSYKSKLIVALIAITVLPIIGVNLFHYLYSSSEFKRLITIEAKAIVKKMKYEMDHLYSDAFQNLEGISSLDEIQEAFIEEVTTEKREKVETLLKHLLTINNIFESYQIVSLEGKQIYKEYVDSSVKKVYLQDIRDRKYFTTPQVTGKPYISDVILARATNKLIIIIGYPIKNHSGEIVGILSGVINFNKIIQITNQINTSPGAYPFITSKEGLLLSHTDKTIIGKKHLFSICKMSLEDQERIRVEEEGFIRYQYKGINKFLYFISDKNDKYIIYYAIPKSDYFSNIYKLRFMIIAVALLVSTLSIILAYFVSEKVKRAIRSVQYANKQVEEKNRQLKSLASKLAKYLSPQLYRSIFSGERDVKIETYRKKLTVFFSDIKDFSQITDSMQSEALSSLLNEYLNEMSKIALRYGGTIDKYIGDAIMIFFGDPDSNGDKEDALACVSMAIEMRKTMATLHERWLSKGVSRPLKIRIGINTGYCTIGNFGSEERLDYTIIGGEVNLASRLESSSDVDKILISHETYALIKDTIYCQPVGELKVKGIAYKVKTYEVIDFIESLENRGQIEFTTPGLSLQLDITKIVDRDLMLEKLQDTINVLTDHTIMNN